MNKRTLYISILLGLLCLGAPTLAHAQIMGAQDFGRDPRALTQAMQSMQNNPYAGEVELDENGNPINPEEGQTDSVKVKEIMPLESFFFGDSIRKQKHFVWNVDTYANHVKMRDIDTLLGSFNYDYPFQREDVGDANVGIVVENMVLAATDLGIDSVILGGAPVAVAQDPELMKDLQIPEGYTPLLGVVFGYGAEDTPVKEHTIEINRV